MKAAIITVGDELISGEKPDTNFSWLARRLASIGIEVVLHESVGDDEVAIARALRATRDVAPVVIVTGGLGPTSDDVTREGIARALGRQLTFNEAVAARLSDRFAEAEKAFLDVILKQAYAVEKAEVIMAERGTAPGLILFDGDQVIYVLPGVPAELQEMFDGAVARDLAERFGDLVPLRRHTVRTAGMPEAEIQSLIADLEPVYGAVRFGLLAHSGLVDLVLTARESESADVGEAIEEIRARLGTVVYGAGDERLEAVVGGMLVSRGHTIATAESCTGGLLGKIITDTPGSSQYYRGGVVAYSDEAKVAGLGVRAATIQAHGVVSEPAVREMADGVKERFGADLGVAISGIAGPSGGTERNPVGTVYVCLLHGSGEVCAKVQQPGSRDQVRLRAAHMALDQVRLHLLRDSPGAAAGG